ncbi:hypothetical protein LGV59_12985 [Bacteroides fragilis]|nr:hypothetical protein [Bacteroides fragilis]
MKKTYLWTAMLCTAIAFSACKSNKAGQDTASEAKTEEAAIPGSDKDEHGCVGSAGYVWSEVKKDCIRPFEAGLKISETQKTTLLTPLTLYLLPTLCKQNSTHPSLKEVSCSNVRTTNGKTIRSASVARTVNGAFLNRNKKHLAPKKLSQIR